MKKNMLAVLILVVLIVNLTLTAYMIFTIVPNAKRTDQLITKILQIVDLELESPLPKDVNVTWSIEDVEKVTLDSMTCNLAAGEDGKAHYAVIEASLTINTKDEDYEKLNPKVEVMKADIKSFYMKETSKHTFEELNDMAIRDEVKETVLNDIQTLFGSKFIVDITLDYLFQ